MNEYRTPIVMKLVEGAFANPLYEREWIFREADEMIAGVVLMQVPHDVIPNRVHIAELRAIAKGGGRKVMDLITKRADDLGVALDLMPVPQRRGFYLKPLTLRKLVAWYRTFGFELQGRMTDGYMIRYPKKGMAENPIYPKGRSESPDGPTFKAGDRISLPEWTGSETVTITGYNKEKQTYSYVTDEGQRDEISWVYIDHLSKFDENPIYHKKRYGTPPGGIRPYGPGKYDFIVDSLVHHFDADDDMSDGQDIYLRIKLKTAFERDSFREDVRKQATDTGVGNLTEEEEKLVDTTVQFIMHERQDGLVKVDYYSSHHRGNEAWKDIEEKIQENYRENPIYGKKRRAFNVGDCVRSKEYPELVGDVRTITSSPYDETDAKYTVAISKPTGVFLYEYFEEEIERADAPC